MVIESNLHLGKGIVRGDAFPIYRIITALVSGVTISSAQLTLKVNITDADPGLFQKSIAPANVAGTGRVEDIGTSGTGQIRFDIVSANTLLMTADYEYYFDIQLKLSNGEVRTIERGYTSAKSEVTTI